MAAAHRQPSPVTSLPGVVDEELLDEELIPESSPPPARPAQPPARLDPPASAPVPVRSDSAENRAAFLDRLGIQAAPSDPPLARRTPSPLPPKAPKPVEAPAPLPPVNAVPNAAASAHRSMAGPPEITHAPGPPAGLSPTDDPGYSPTHVGRVAMLGADSPSSFRSEKPNGAPVQSSGPKIHNLKSNKKSEPTKEMMV